MKTLKGLALQDILFEVHAFVHRFVPAPCVGVKLPYRSVDFPPKVRIFILEKLGDIEFVPLLTPTVAHFLPGSGWRPALPRNCR